MKAKIGVKAIYDLSATPFFLRGSGYPEGTLFPWVVSDFSLIDAIEAGIVKVPRVPVADDSMTGAQPTYRDLWLRIREHLPKKGRKTNMVVGEPKLPVELQGALLSLYSNYEKYYACGRTIPTPAHAASRRQCSSSSATTPTSPSWSLTLLLAGKSRSAKRPSSRPGNCPSSATTTAKVLGYNARTPSW